MSSEVPEGSTPLTGLVAMKNWDDARRCWIGTVCQAFRFPDGKESVVIYDVADAATQVEIDDWGRQSIETKPWERDGDD